VPYSWLLWIDYPWGSYRWFWMKLWPILPGLLPPLLLRPYVGNAQIGLYLGAIAATLTVVSVGLLICTRSRRAMYISCAIVLAASIGNAWFAYAIFRA
jgi:hypothetical protein